MMGLCSWEGPSSLAPTCQGLHFSSDACGFFCSENIPGGAFGCLGTLGRPEFLLGTQATSQHHILGRHAPCWQVSAQSLKQCESEMLASRMAQSCLLASPAAACGCLDPCPPAPHCRPGRLCTRQAGRAARPVVRGAVTRPSPKLSPHSVLVSPCVAGCKPLTFPCRQELLKSTSP